MSRVPNAAALALENGKPGRFAFAIPEVSLSVRRPASAGGAG